MQSLEIGTVVYYTGCCPEFSCIMRSRITKYFGRDFLGRNLYELEGCDEPQVEGDIQLTEEDAIKSAEVRRELAVMRLEAQIAALRRKQFSVFDVLN